MVYLDSDSSFIDSYMNDCTDAFKTMFKSSFAVIVKVSLNNFVMTDE